MLWKIFHYIALNGSSISIASSLLFSLIVFYSPLALSSVHELNHSINRWPYNSKLSQSTILGIVTDRNNVLWILTLDGISRFDGNEFLEFRPYKSGIGSISSSKVIQIVEDSFGDVYALTEDKGLLVYDDTKSQFIVNVLNIEHTSESFSVSTSFPDLKGSVWIGGKRGEILKLKPRLGITEKVQLSTFHEIVDFTQSNNDSVYAITKKGEIFRLFSGEASHENVFHTCKGSGMEISAIAAINDRSIWIGTRDSGLFIANLEDQDCQKIPLKSGIDSQQTQPIIHDILYSSSTGSAWISTDHALYRIDKNNTVTHYNTANSNISDDWVIAISESDEGRFWIGTYDGLNYAIPTHFEVFGAGESSEINSVVGIDSHNEKGCWIAMYDGLKYLDFETKLHSDHKNLLEFSQLKNNQIMSLNVDQDGIWVGYHSSGLEHYSFDTRKRTYYGIQEENTLSSNAITKIVTAESGDVLVGTYGGGLNIIREHGETESISIGDNRVIMLHETRNGVILIGTESGLFSYIIDSKRLSEISFNYSEFALFAEPLFWSITESENGDLWLGSKQQGLFLWKNHKASRTQPEIIEPVSLRLKNLTIYALEVDSQGLIWMSTNSGLISYDPSNSDTQIYSILHGLHKTKFDHGVSHKDLLGNLYFGGNSGYVRFDPLSIRLRKRPPRLSFSKLESASNPGGFVPSSGFSNRVKLSHTDYFVKLTFSVMDFLDPDKNQYRYKLEGFDPDWIENGTSNTATYTNLPAGHYVFRVQGANSAGIWNREGLALDVEVLPPWWLTWWAYTFYILSGAFAIWVLMRWYHTYMVKESALETAHNMQEVALRTEDDLQEQYELQDRLLQSVYHHNKSTLKLINNCIHSQSHNISDDIYQEGVESSTRRIDALAVLEDCIYYQGDEILADFRSYADRIIPTLLLDAPVRAETVTTINDLSADLLPVGLASPLAIITFELLENSLHHAFEPRSSANYIHLVSKFESSDADDQPRFYSLTIRDSGLGIPGNIDLNALETSGLAIVQSLVKRLSGTLQIFAEGGTTVSVVVPLPDASETQEFL